MRMCSWFENKLQEATKKASTIFYCNFREECLCQRGDRPIAATKQAHNTDSDDKDLDNERQT